MYDSWIFKMWTVVNYEWKEGRTVIDWFRLDRGSRLVMYSLLTGCGNSKAKACRGRKKWFPYPSEFLTETLVIKDRWIRGKQKFINMYTSSVHRGYSWENENSRVAYNVGLIISSAADKEESEDGEASCGGLPGKS